MLPLGTLPWMLAQRDPHHPVLAVEGVHLEARELDGAASAIAARLLSRGVGPGDHCAILCGNGVAFCTAYYGILRIGAVAIPLSMASSHRERVFALRHVRPRILIADADMLPRAVRAANEAGTGLHLLGLGEGSTPHADGCRDAVDVMTLADAPRQAPAPTDMNAAAVILSTSGTTGQPKWAVHSHAALLHNAHVVAVEILGMTPDDRQLGVLPLSHSFGMSAVLNATVLAGARVTLVRRPQAVPALQAATRDGVTIIQSVPTLLSRLADAVEGGAPRPTALRRIVVSGAPCPAPTAQRVHAHLGGELLERWGMTECSPLSMRTVPHDGGLPGDVGHPIGGAAIRVAGGARVGELEASTPAMFLNYLNDPASSVAVRPDGFLRTGDLGSIRNDGGITLSGRLKDVVVRAGNNVNAREVERVIEEHEDVVEAAVVGVADADVGEEIAAFLVLRRPAASVLPSVQAHVAMALAHYKVPRRWTVMNRLPRTASGKVVKDRLREMGSTEADC